MKADRAIVQQGLTPFPTPTLQGMNAQTAEQHRQQTRTRIAQVQARLALLALAHRPPPPEPTTCCGRGCNGCVWEGYETALAWWFDDAQVLLQTTQPPNASTAPEASNGTNEPT